MLPLLTRYLSPSDYGVVATFQVLLAFLVIFISLNVNSAVSVTYFTLTKKELRIYIGNVVGIIIVNFVFILCFTCIFKEPIARVISFPSNWILIAVVAALSQVIISLTLILWQVEQKPIFYGKFQILQAIVNVGLSVALVVGLGWKWEGRLLGIIFALAVFGLIGSFVIYKRNYIKFSFNLHYIKDALFFGIGLIPATLSWWIITGIDKLFINSMVGVSETGIYSIAVQLGLIIGLIANSFNLAWAPFLFEKLTQVKFGTKLKIVRFTYAGFGGIILLTIVFIVIAPFFIKVFIGDDFQYANKYIAWIAVGQLFNSMRYFVINYIYYVKKTYISGGITFFTALMNAVLNYYLIKLHGAIGAAYATAITFFVNFVLTWTLCAKVYKMPWFDKLVFNFRRC